MDASRRSRPADAHAAASEAVDTLRGTLSAALARECAPHTTAAIALSGGRDSMTLLDAAAAVAPALHIELIACHVHHGLSSQADAWLDVCATACARHGVRFLARRVGVRARARESLEAAARTARYEALAAMARESGARCVLLAHHQDDQAETLLLQLLRGGGPRGLAGMPAAQRARGVTWLRPLLDLPRAAIDAYVAARQLEYVEDDSNVATRFRRNALRKEVVPALREVSPGYPATLARAASHQADAAQLLNELAAQDAAGHCDGATLDRAALAALAPHRARNLLRWFLHEQGLAPPSSARLAAMLAQLRDARADATVRLRHAGAEIGLFRDRICAHASAPAPFAQPWHGESTLTLPHGTLELVATDDGGVDVARLFAARVMVRSREGGERVRLGAARPQRALKSVLREAALAPWEREALPLVFADGALAVVPGVGFDPAFAARPDAPGSAIVWRPHAPTRRTPPPCG
jgi:tRNA(Ile)-lysidine synthase